MAAWNKHLTETNAYKWMIIALHGTSVLLDLILLGSSATQTGQTVWQTASIWLSGIDYLPLSCLCLVILFFIGLTAAVIGCDLLLVRGTARRFPFGIGLAVHTMILVLCATEGIMGIGGILLPAFQMLLSLLGILFAAKCKAHTERMRPARKTLPKASENSQSNAEKRRKNELLCLALCSMLPILSLFPMPFCTYIYEGTEFSLIALSVLSRGADTLGCFIVFACLIVLCPISIFLLFACFEHAADSERVFVANVRRLIAYNTALTGSYFVAGVGVCAISNIDGGHFTTESYPPFLMSAAICILYALLVRGMLRDTTQKRARKAQFARIEFFLYGTALSALCAASALTEILAVHVTEPVELDMIRLHGFDLLFGESVSGAGFELLAFLLLTALTITVGLFLASLVSMISGSKLFYRITLMQLISSAVCILSIGLFGKYYELVQKMNEEMILSWIGEIMQIETLSLEYEVSSISFLWTLLAAVVIAVALIRKPYTKGTIGDTVIAVEAPLKEKIDPKEKDKPTPEKTKYAPPMASPAPLPSDIDPCPAFTELDRKANQALAQTAAANALAFESPTLSGLVRFLVDYARDSRLHLFYTPQDIAAFVAGLGATRLTILQGMSGTGKTSLPKIFSEAIMGACDIVEVESSWRDKNELLGYYNEFSKTYTPRKFTQALYKAKLNPDRLTFIVLDEMNLSRVEYYFSDFLSLMENEPDKREIKLLQIGLYRTENQEKQAYFGLSDGHTMKIPSNVWFIGTANRDESTFEISDKVYDRAHTMNFNRRASKVAVSNEPQPTRFLSTDAFSALLDQAKQNGRFTLEDCTLITEAERLLAPYNITFGNRVARQIEDFVNIYCACFPPSADIKQEAVETILLSKVVSKLEYRSVENKTALALSFERLGLMRCGAFIRKLNED